MNAMPNQLVTAQPVEAAQAEKLANSLFATVEAFEIDSPEVFAMAGTELQAISKRKKEIEAQRVHVKEPFLEGCRRIDAFFRIPLDRLDQAEKLLKGRMLAFQQAEEEKAAQARREAEAQARKERLEQERIQREAEAEQQRIREEAARQQREAEAEAQRRRDEIAAAERKAAEEAEALRKTGDEEAARAAEDAADAARHRAEQEAREAAEAAAKAQEQAERDAAEAAAKAEQAREAIELSEIAPIAMPTTIAPKAAGVSTRQNWKAEVQDLQALICAAADAFRANGDTTLMAYLQADESALGKVAKALKNQARIPGVRIYNDPSMAVRIA